MPRFSLKTLLVPAAGLLAVIGLLTAPFTAEIVATYTVLSWVAAVTVWMKRDQPLRTFAGGYVVGSLIYAFVAFRGDPAVLFREELENVIEPFIQASLTLNPEFSRDSSLHSFLWVTHCYLCVLVGVSFGWGVAWLYGRLQKVNRPCTKPSNP